MTIKRYRIADHEESFVAVIEVDDTKMTEAELNSINTFWGGAEARLLEARGDITRAVLKLLWNALWWSQAHHGNLTLDGLLCQFSWNGKNGIEGWPNLDGSAGIKLIACSEVEPPDDYYTTVTEISVPEAEGSEVVA